MDAISDPSIREVILPWSAQTGKTSSLINGLGYYIHTDPCPMMWISTTIIEVESFAKTRFSAFRRDNPVIAERVLGIGPKKSTLDEWKFPGGRLLFRGSNSPVGLRSNPIRVLIMDEVDGYPFSTVEGEPTMLARKRLQAYEAVGISKAILASTPASASESRIWPAYLRSDQRKFFVPCPHCGAEQTLCETVAEFMATVKWDKSSSGKHLPATAQIHCKECGAGWNEQQRKEAVSKGRWIAQAPEVTSIAGFWINELYSSFSSLERVVTQFLVAKDEPRRFQQWVNLVLGVPWEDETEGETEWKRVYEKREDYPIGVVPKGAVTVTAGVDVQSDRLEVEIVAWNARFESWSMDYRIFRGDPRKEEVWKELDVLLEERFPKEGAEEVPTLRIAVLGVDAGYATDQVEKWVAKKSQRRVIATRGESQRRIDYPIGTPRRVEMQRPGKKRQRGIVLYPLGVDWMKEELLHGWLRQERPTDEELASGVEHPSGYCHFPRAYGQEYFQQLCSEKKIWRVNKMGNRKLIWEKVFERNEALDCRLIARAAACFAGLDRLAMRPAPRERKVVPAPTPEAPPVTTPEERTAPTARSSKRGGGWMGRRSSSWLR